MFVERIQILAPEPTLLGTLKVATFVLFAKFMLGGKMSLKFPLTPLGCALKKLNRC